MEALLGVSAGYAAKARPINRNRQPARLLARHAGSPEGRGLAGPLAALLGQAQSGSCRGTPGKPASQRPPLHFGVWRPNGRLAPKGAPQLFQHFCQQEPGYGYYPLPPQDGCSVTVTTVPSPGWLRRAISPWWTITACFTMESPRPVPPTALDLLLSTR